jgi:hypothetical protein
MTTEREFDTLLRSWLDEEARSDPPASVLASVLGETGHSRPRPAWLVRLGGEPMRDAGRVGVHRMVPIALAGTAILLAVAIGIGVIARPERNVGPSPVPLPSAVVTPSPAPPLGNGSILTFKKLPASDECLDRYTVFSVDPGTGAATELGATDAGCDAGWLVFQWALDRRHVLMTDDLRSLAARLDSQTDAGRELEFICCDLPTDVWQGGQGPNDGWVLSPRGDLVAALHTSETAEGDAIVVVNIDGSNERTYPFPSGASVIGISWSPDESVVAGVGCLPCNTADHGQPTTTVNHQHVFLVPLDGAPIRQLLDDAQGGFSVPAWSPDGATFVVAQGDCQPGDTMPACNPDRISRRIVKVLVADGTTSTLLAGNQVGGDYEQMSDPLVAPDGSHITFSAWSGDGIDSAIFVSDANGGNLVRLVDGSVPQWSPDGALLLFARASAPQWPAQDLWIIGADGEQLRHLGVFSGATW